MAETETTTQPADRLLLALRTCATHPAGPLRAVAELVEMRRTMLLSGEQVSEVAAEVRQRIAEQDMSDERRVILTSFLDAIFDGVLLCT